MNDYQAPIDDLRFALRTHGDLAEVLSLPNFVGLDDETIDAIIEEAGRFAGSGWADSNIKGDLNGAKLLDGKIISDESFYNVYNEFRDAGWASLSAPEEFGGQQLPHIVASACDEMWCSGNIALSLMQMLTNGALLLLNKFADDSLKQKLLPQMCSGQWSGTMCLTEPQAGSDLSQIKCKAVLDDNGQNKISGQKIYITWGEQEITDNIIHLVLARLPNAPAGVKGISLFAVPKYRFDGDNVSGNLNNVSCISIEHKLGLHGSPTCVMQFDEAEGFLVGEEGRGLQMMFVMMNHARLCVGIEGHAVSERAFQAAREYSKERIQSRSITADKNAQPVRIIEHPDVRRMLLEQKATLEAQRALYLMTASMLDKASHPNPEYANQNKSAAEFMVPVIKAFLSENAIRLTNLAMQCFGGMGYIEETGVSQLVRDARITSIYEGTNGIQALDLVGRKTVSDKGKTATYLLNEANIWADKLTSLLPNAAQNLNNAIATLKQSVVFILDNSDANKPEYAASGSLPYLMQTGTVLAAAQMAKAYVVAQEALDNIENAKLHENFYRNKQANAKVYLDYILPNAQSYAMQLQNSSESILSIQPDDI